MNFLKTTFFFLFLIALSSCGAYKEVVTFPPSDVVFITSGDGDIAKPYEPLGELVYFKRGSRIPVPLLGLIPINDVKPDKIIREIVAEEVRRMGGNGLINMKIKKLILL